MAEHDDLRARLASLVEIGQGNAWLAADALIASGVFVPPESATRTEGRAITMTPDGEPFPYTGEIEHRDGRSYYHDVTGAERDITDDLASWAARQPGVIVVTYEWPEPSPICPECRDGKHRNCTGEALNEYLDEIVPCRCDHPEEVGP
jgi:hypothetical protein